MLERAAYRLLAGVEHHRDLFGPEAEDVAQHEDSPRYASLAQEGERTHAERLVLLREHAAQVATRIAALREQDQHLHDKIGWHERHLP